jgi:dihydrodiol dehydrogenase / D-xylose 1-dehydrogenase (NADP)
MEMQYLRWGILGCGKISHDFVLAMRMCEHANVVRAVATADSLERAREFLESLRGEGERFDEATVAYGSYEELLNDVNIDAVYIGILNKAHCEWVVNAIEHGKHVLCEKPMTACAAEVQLIIEKARQHGVFVMEAFWSRFFPIWAEIRKAINGGEMGQLRMICANFGTTELSDNRMRTDIAECPFIDIGVYLVMFAMFCVNDIPPSSINVTCAREAPTGCDSSGNITLEFNGGVQKAYLMYSVEANTPISAFVSFENGTILEIPEWFNCPTRMRRMITTGVGASAENRTTKEWFEFPLYDVEKGDKPERYNFNNGSGLRYETDHVYECIKNGHKESPVMSLQSSYRIAQVCEQIRKMMGVEFPVDKKGQQIGPL